MRISISLANTVPFDDPVMARDLAIAADEAGIHALWTVEHIIWPSSYSSAYPYHPSGKMPGDADTPLVDPLIWLTWVAAQTERVRLATGILLLPERNPLITAKAVATLDRLSGGRVVLGVGIGWLREEFEALGIPFEGRAARTDEYIEVLRALWAPGATTFRGEFASFADVHSSPKPVDGSVPIVIGGHSPGAARRAGRLGDGFFPAGIGLDRVEELFGVAKEAAAEAGRDPDALTLVSNPPSGLRNLDEDLEQLRSIGCTEAVLPAFLFRKDPGSVLGSLAGHLD